MNRILCLDLGTTTGFAFHSEGDVSHGIKKFPKDLVPVEYARLDKTVLVTESPGH